MSEADRAMWRKNAVECVDLARITTDSETKQLLLTRAQEWLRLAYSEGDTEFERVLSTFNKGQMVSGAHPRPAAAQPRPSGAQARPTMQRTATQQQPRQQQQSKSRRDGNGSSRS
jgi:hypothetical protein